MDLIQQVKNWIEKNLGKKISEDLKKMIKEEGSTFDVESYINDLYENYFNKSKIDIIRQVFQNSSDILKSYDSDNSSQDDYVSQEIFDFEPNEFPPFSDEEIIKSLKNNSKEVRIKCLRQLGSFDEDLLSHTSWNSVKLLLQNFLKTNNDGEINGLTLKVFQRLLFCHNKPQIVCESFLSISEIFFFHTGTVNCENVVFEEFYDLKTNKLLDEKNLMGSRRQSKCDGGKLQQYSKAELSIKLMFLLVECQNQMPEKWIRFTEKRLREIIFGFINLLSSTTINSQKENLSGLELLSILSPTAKWCRHWCHTSTGRLLLCKALRKHKNFFICIIKNIIFHVKTRVAHHLKNKTTRRNFTRLSSASDELEQELTFSTAQSTSKIGRKNYINERQKCIRSAPPVPILVDEDAANCQNKNCKSFDFATGYIPRKVAEEALFCHNVSFVTCLIQYRSGRSLFPIQMLEKKRLVSVQDLISQLINYLENFDGDRNVGVTQTYHQHIENIVESLKNVQVVLSARGTSAQRLELSKR